MAITIKNLKVRTQKQMPKTMCAANLTALLGCWSATGDVHSRAECQELAQALFHCMRTTPVPAKIQKPTINYHLARLSKRIN